MALEKNVDLVNIVDAVALLTVSELTRSVEKLFRLYHQAREVHDVIIDGHARQRRDEQCVIEGNHLRGDVRSDD